MKNSIFRMRRGPQKKQDMVGLPKRGGLRQFQDLRGSWRKRGGGVFEGIVDTLMHPMCGFHGRHVSVKEIGNIMSYVFLTVQCTTGHEFHRILYIQIAHVFEGNFKPQLQVFEFLVEM